MKPRVFVPAIASGVLLWLAFFPCDLGPLGFVALVPWLTLVRAPVSGKRRYFAAYLGGVVFFALAAKWVRVAHPMMYLSWLGLAVVMPVFWLAALAIIRRLDALKVPLAISVPVAWVALEYFRMHFPTGFPFMKHIGAYQMIGFGWYFLGYTQHAFTPLIQIADAGGVYAVSFVVGAVNGALAELWLPRPAVVNSSPGPLPAARGSSEGTHSESDSRSGSEVPSLPLAAGRGPGLSWARVGGLAFALALVGASLGYGFWRLDHAAFVEGPVVSALQVDFGQDEKMGDPSGLRLSYYQLHEKAFRGSPTPDLIVWPETCQPVDWVEIAPAARNENLPPRVADHWKGCQEDLLGIGWGAPVLFGLNGIEWDGQRARKYNSALLLNPISKNALAVPKDQVIARSEVAGRYDKMHLVPFGEYVPLGDELPFMKAFTPYKYNYSCTPGEQWTRFPVAARDGRKFTFACLICYEDSDPYLARQYVKSDSVDFLVNISNDGWFKGTEEHEQHLAICRFRAIEARRAVVRSVNMGISGFIDSDGRVLKIPGETWSRSKKVDAVVTAVVPVDNRASLYATLGDWVPAGCWLVALVGVAVGFVRRKPLAA